MMSMADFPRAMIINEIKKGLSSNVHADSKALIRSNYTVDTIDSLARISVQRIINNDLWYHIVNEDLLELYTLLKQISILGSLQAESLTRLALESKQ